MKHTYKEDDYERLAFDSIHELVDFISTDENRNGIADRSSESGDSSFTGTASLKEALELVEKGDSKLLERIDVRNSSVKEANAFVENVKRSFTNDVVGFTPNVANAVMGIPTNMIRMHKVYHKQKIVNIAVNISVSGGVRKEDMIKNSAILYAAVDSLELQGYRCNVWVTEVARGNGVQHTFTVKVKTDNQPFNRLKLAFPMAHPSMLRRFGFAINERSKHWIGGGYGTPQHGERAEKEVKETLGIDNVYVVDIMKLENKGINGIKEGAMDLRYEQYHGLSE